MSSITRRQFLKNTAVVLAGFTFPSPRIPSWPNLGDTKKRRIRTLQGTGLRGYGLPAIDCPTSPVVSGWYSTQSPPVSPEWPVSATAGDTHAVRLRDGSIRFFYDQRNYDGIWTAGMDRWSDFALPPVRARGTENCNGFSYFLANSNRKGRDDLNLLGFGWNVDTPEAPPADYTVWKMMPKVSGEYTDWHSEAVTGFNHTDDMHTAAVNRRGIRIVSGSSRYHFVPCHWGDVRASHCGFLRSSDDGTTWQRLGDIGGTTTMNLSECGIVDITSARSSDVRLYMICRREKTDDHPADFQYCITDKEGNVIQELRTVTGIAVQDRRAGGNPPCPIRLDDGRMFLLYSGGNEEDHWDTYVSTDNGASWVEFGKVKGRQNGGVWAHRYADVENINEYWVQVSAGEPDGFQACQRCRIMVGSPKVIELFSNSNQRCSVETPYNTTIFSLYIEPTAFHGTGQNNTMLYFHDGVNVRMGWQLGVEGGGQVITKAFRDGSLDAVSTGYNLFLHHITCLRIEYIKSERTTRYWINDELVRTVSDLGYNGNLKGIGLSVGSNAFRLHKQLVEGY